MKATLKIISPSGVRVRTLHRINLSVIEDLCPSLRTLKRRYSSFNLSENWMNLRIIETTAYSVNN